MCARINLHTYDRQNECNIIDSIQNVTWGLTSYYTHTGDMKVLNIGKNDNYMKSLHPPLPQALDWGRRMPQNSKSL
jgi:hypothetical protein